jgi:glycosyltransferase involved in cell wall biosynthesis
MNIVLIVSSMESGGAERVASTLANSWTERGDSVTLVVTFSGRGTCFYSVSSKVRLVYLADLVARKGRGPLTYLARFAALRRVIRSGKPDVIVSFLTSVNIASILASRGLGIPIVACEHNDPSADGRSIRSKLLCRLVYREANVLTFLSETIAMPFRNSVPRARRIAVVPNPLPDDLFLESRPPVEAGARKRLISVGRLHVQKQYDLLIATFASLAGEFSDWDLWIWGDGPERASLEASITKLGMTDRIFLPGTTKTPWKEMARADAFVLSSRYEGMPMALMEGMALGLPAVAFDCRSGPRELMREGRDGLLIPSGNTQAMADALRRLFSVESLRAELGNRAAVSVRQRYSVHAVLGIWDDLFAQLAGK